MTEVRKRPCAACPYRADVPSGLWATDEYEKLRAYDHPTALQPFAGFSCHSSPEQYCHGWAVVHSNRGHENELLALRIRPTRIPESTVQLFRSGNEAADHGQADIECPGPDAVKAVTKLQRMIEGRLP